MDVIFLVNNMLSFPKTIKSRGVRGPIPLETGHLTGMWQRSGPIVMIASSIVSLS